MWGRGAISPIRRATHNASFRSSRRLRTQSFAEAVFLGKIRLADQTEQQQKMELLREQYQTGAAFRVSCRFPVSSDAKSNSTWKVAPIVGVTVDGAEGLESDSKRANLDTYCVIEIANKPYTRLQTGVLKGAEPAWDFTGLLQNYAFGDVLKFAVYCK
ncbi:ARO1, partial [Symbiodinium microadriaticum]